MTEQIFAASVDDLLPGHEQEIARLGMLVEAAARLLGTLDLDTVLPEVLELGRATLEVDAYALWRHDVTADNWSLQASAGLSEGYVEAALRSALGQQRDFSLDEPVIANDVVSTDWLTGEQKAAHAAQGNRAFLALPLRHRDEMIGTLVFYARRPRTFAEPELRVAASLADIAAAAIGTAGIHDEQARLAESRRLLAEASEQLASSLDYETTLSNVAALVVPTFADWCVVDIVAEDGSIQRLAVAHEDPAMVERAHALIERLPIDPHSGRGVAEVIRTQRPQVMPEITDDELEERFADRPEVLADLQALGLRSWMTVPLVVRRRALGAITFLAAESGRRYGDSDLPVALDLARRAATAVDNAFLYREALLKESQVRFLAEAGSVLGELLDYDAMLGALARLAVPRLADWCIVDVVDGAEIRRVAVAAASGNKQAALEELQEHYPPTWDSPQPAARALREGAPMIFDFEPGQLEQTVIDERHLEILRRLDPHSAVAIPLVAKGEKVGAITFAWAQSDQRYSERDLPLMEDLASRAALAVDNARLYARERAAGDQLAFLAEMSSVLASSLDYETTLANVADLIVPRFADWCVVDVVGEDGSIRRLAVVHKDADKVEWATRLRDAHPPIPDEPEGAARVIRTGEPVLYRRITDQLLESSAPGPENLHVLRELGMASAMVVPMKARGRTLGALMLVSSHPDRLYDDDALTFAEHLGRRAAIVVDNALIYRSSEQRAQAARALAFVADGVMLLDDGDVVRIWNAAAEVITGLPAHEVVGRPVGEAVPGWAAIAAHVPVAAGPGTPRAETVPVELAHGERWLSISGVSLPGGTVYAFRDLTEEQRAERLKSEFVSTISHELRTPLAAIYGAALTLRRQEPALQAQRESLLDVVAGESERLARIVNDILWVSRLESGTLHVAVERCDAAELVSSVIAASTAHLPPNLTLTVDAEPDTPPVAADADKVRQILMNLIDNAVKYSPDGGTIRVRVERDGPVVRFLVSDEGLGVPAAEHGRIFEKFYRLDPELTRGVGGTGLGLYISRELVRRMDGRIGVESVEGEGSRFSIELPIAR